MVCTGTAGPVAREAGKAFTARKAMDVVGPGQGFTWATALMPDISSTRRVGVPTGATTV